LTQSLLDLILSRLYSLESKGSVQMTSLEQKLIKLELTQRQEEGCDTEEISRRITAVLEKDSPGLELVALYDELVKLPVQDSFPYREPSSLEDIQALRPDSNRKLDMAWDDKQLFDRIYGAWLGRAAGCALGKPVEGWPKHRIDNFLIEADVLPLDNYLPFMDKFTIGTHKPSTRDNIQYMDRDDDMDYSILGLLALERKGAKLTSRTVADTWLAYMPFSLLYTAENAAYRNFVMSIWPPQSALHRNPFREWIGAQIRADIFGYAAPAWPQKAAELAYRDACISHDKNGIYGEMFVAAMIAAAFVYTRVEDIVVAGLGEIPAECRLAEAVQSTLTWCQKEEEWEAVWEKINARYGHYHGVHTINNAALVVMGLYFGEKNFEQGIVTAVRAGWDTDCNGATVGSILGAKFGATSLPDKWVGVLNDRLMSAVTGQNENKISDLARRTLHVAKEVASFVDRRRAPVPAAEIKGTWELETGWGRQLLRFTRGCIEFIDGGYGPFEITSSSYSKGHLKFSFSIDKHGWDLEVDFEGNLQEDTIEGAYYPGDIPVKGTRKSSE
jgi:ADP-ribosylglycohydrolase